MRTSKKNSELSDCLSSLDELDYNLFLGIFGIKTRRLA